MHLGCPLSSSCGCPLSQPICPLLAGEDEARQAADLCKGASAGAEQASPGSRHLRSEPRRQLQHLAGVQQALASRLCARPRGAWAMYCLTAAIFWPSRVRAPQEPAGVWPAGQPGEQPGHVPPGGRALPSQDGGLAGGWAHARSRGHGFRLASWTSSWRGVRGGQRARSVLPMNSRLCPEACFMR